MYIFSRGKFILENNSLEFLVVFPPIFMADTEIIYGYNFVALLKNELHHNTYFLEHLPLATF